MKLLIILPFVVTFSFFLFGDSSQNGLQSNIFEASIVEMKVLEFVVSENSTSVQFEITTVLAGDNKFKGSVFYVSKESSGKAGVALLSRESIREGDLFITAVIDIEDKGLIPYIPMVYEDFQWSFPTDKKDEGADLLRSFSRFINKYEAGDLEARSKMRKNAIENKNPYIKRFARYLESKEKDWFAENPLNF
jgi:hypothetical protein